MMTIIREKIQITGSKRLGECLVVVDGHQDGLSSRDNESAIKDALLKKDALRKTFAAELMEIEEEARRHGVLAAEKELTSKLQILESDYQERINTENEKRNAALSKEKEQIQKVVAVLGQEVQSFKSAAESAVLEIAFVTVVKLLGERAADRRLLGELASKAVTEHGLSGSVCILVSKADYEFLQVLPDQGMGVDFLPDDSLKSGDCIIRFGQGRIDAGLDGQLTAIKDIFIKSLAVRHEDT